MSRTEEDKAEHFDKYTGEIVVNNGSLPVSR